MSESAEAQEVEMFGKKTVSEFDRKKAQQERLVNKDFPWLWGIRQCWHFGALDISVSNNEEELSKFIEKATHNDEGIEFWIKYKNTQANTGYVQKISLKEDGSFSWARQIKPTLDNGVLIENIVIIFHLHEPTNKKKMVIYRARDKQGLITLNVIVLATIYRMLHS